MSAALYWHFVRLRFRERLEYRGAFVMGLFAQALGYIADFTVFWILVHRFGALGGWDWSQIAFLYSLNLMGYAIGAAFTYSPMTELESMAQRGTFDGVLIRPLNPFASLTAQMFNVGYLGHIVLASLILGWSIDQLTVDWTFVKIVFLVASVAGASLIHAAILTILGAWSFLFVRSGFLFGFAGSLRIFVLYPITIYNTAVQVLLTVVFPIAFVNYFPAAILLDKDGQWISTNVGWLTPPVGLLAFFLGYKLWMRSINRYQSAGG